MSLYFCVKMLSECFVEHEVNLVVAEGLLEVGNSSLLVDANILDASHLGKVLPILLGDVVRESAVVCTTSQNPGCSTNLECRLWNPQSRSYRKFWHWLRLDALNLLADQTETVAKVNNCSLNTSTSLRCEYQTCSLLLADTNTEEMNLELWLVGSNQRTNLQHVALQTRTLVASEVQGVVLEE